MNPQKCGLLILFLLCKTHLSKYTFIKYYMKVLLFSSFYFIYCFSHFPPNVDTTVSSSVSTLRNYFVLPVYLQTWIYTFSCNILSYQLGINCQVVELNYKTPPRKFFVGLILFISYVWEIYNGKYYGRRILLGYWTSFDELLSFLVTNYEHTNLFVKEGI